MITLQKASLGKRIIAAIFDFILLSIIAVGLAAVFSAVFGYNGHMDTVNEAYAKYQKEYGVELQITAEQYEAFDEAQKQNYDAALTALNTDEDVIYAYNMLINLTMLIMTLSILISVIVIEFVVPKLFGNGQTLGKKIFGIGLMHTEGIEVSSVQLFARAVLGKFVFGLMIPLSMIMMIFFNAIGVVGMAILLILAVAQVACLIATKTGSPIHDVIAKTVAVDIASQRIFKTREDLIEFVKARHAEKAARAD
ncbi:MAG: RDD family protein [Oscillospiraceae bacterium]|nr:RDD family protein [Oscillospiraceae bacterium]